MSVLCSATSKSSLRITGLKNQPCNYLTHVRKPRVLANVDGGNRVQKNEDIKTKEENGFNAEQCKWQQSELGSWKEFLATHLGRSNMKVRCYDSLLSLLELAFQQRQLNHQG